MQKTIKNLSYLIIILAMIGSASVFSITIGGFQLSPFRLLVIAVTILMIIEKVTDGVIKYKKRENFYSLVFIAIWLLYSLFTFIWVKDCKMWFRACFFIGTGFLVYIIISTYLVTKEDILKALNLMVPMILIHNIISWYEIFTGNYMFLIEERIEKYTRMSLAVSTFGNTNNLMIFMFFSVFILYICIVNTKRKVFKVVLISILASTLVLVLTSTSRATILGLLISAMTFVIFGIKRKNTRRTLVIILTLILVAFVAAYNQIIGLVENMFDSIQFNLNSESGSDFVRKNLILNGLDFLVRTFGFGTGAGNIEYWMANYAKHDTSEIYNIHNWWFEILTGYGAGIFIMYIIFYYKLIKSMVRRIKHSISSVDISISLGILCILTGYVIVSVTSSSNIQAEWLWTFWGVVVAYQGCSVMTKEDERLIK